MNKTQYEARNEAKDIIKNAQIESENDNTVIPFIYDYAQDFIKDKARMLLKNEEYFINIKR